MMTIENDQLVTATGGVTRRPDGGTCTDPIREPRGPLGLPPIGGPIGGPFNPSPTFPRPGDGLGLGNTFLK